MVKSAYFGPCNILLAWKNLEESVDKIKREKDSKLFADIFIKNESSEISDFGLEKR